LRPSPDRCPTSAAPGRIIDERITIKLGAINGISFSVRKSRGSPSPQGGETMDKPMPLTQLWEIMCIVRFEVFPVHVDVEFTPDEQSKRNGLSREARQRARYLDKCTLFSNRGSSELVVYPKCIKECITTKLGISCVHQYSAND
jgi:hypothetical protein